MTLASGDVIYITSKIAEMRFCALYPAQRYFIEYLKHRFGEKAFAAFPQPNGDHHCLEIMLPGFIVGGIIGLLTQGKGVRPAGRTA